MSGRLLTSTQEELLNELYYKEGLLVGRDRMYKYVSENFPEFNLSRRQVMDWLKNQETAQLYWPTKTTVDIRSTVMKKPHSQIGIDLVDMSNKEYNNYKWILTGYDLFSKMGYAVAMKDKTEKTVVDAMRKLLKNEIHHVESIRSDNGSEFISKAFKKLLEEHEIKQVLSHPGKPQSNGAIERFNKTMKRYLAMRMHVLDSYDWVSILPEFIETYNKTQNDVTNQTPDSLNEEIDESDLKIVRKKITDAVKTPNADEQLFDVKDLVRIKIPPEDRILGQTWSKDVYEISQVDKPKKSSLSSYSYQIKGQNKKYYNNDLQKVTEIQNKIEHPERYVVSKLVKPVFHNKKPAYVVRWKYYTEKDDTIESREQLLEDVPKMVRKFEKDHNVTWYSNRIVWDQS